MQEKEVKNKAGIYFYVFTGEEKDLNLYTFDKHDKTILFVKDKLEFALYAKSILKLMRCMLTI